MDKNNNPSTCAEVGATADEVRTWLRQNGYEVAPSGRIPASLLVAFRDRQR